MVKDVLNQYREIIAAYTEEVETSLDHLKLLKEMTDALIDLLLTYDLDLDAPVKQLSIFDEAEDLGAATSEPEDDDIQVRGEFASRLKNAREYQKYKQNELAAILGVDASTISKWESRSSYPKGKKLERAIAFIETIERKQRRYHNNITVN